MKKLALLGLVMSLALSTVSSATMLREIWSNQVTGTLDDALVIVNGEVGPDRVDVLDDSGWPGDEGSDYVSRLSGWIVVPEDGDYTFYISGDDHCGLWISPDADPANAPEAPAAFVDGWTDWLQWTVNETQKAEPMSLTAGQVMAVYAVHREATGGDNLSIGWTGPGIDTISLLGVNVTHLAYKADVVAPADGATGMVDVVAEWAAPPLVEAPVYNVYGGPDPAALDLLAEGIIETTLAIGRAGVELDFETTYYWRVDVVGQEEGDLWSFTTETGKPIITSVQDAVVLPGEDAQLAVEAMSFAEGELTYQWYRTEVEIMGIVLKDVLLPAGIAAVLDVPAATVAEEGDYYCVVTNDIGSTTSDLAILDVQVGLIHRYSFTDDTSDSVGGADGVLVNNTGNAAVVDGQAVMGNVGPERADNGDGDYIDLPNGLISNLSQMTVQVWATYTDADLAIWSRILSFGESDGGEDASPGGGSSTYFTIQPNRSGNVAGFEYRNKGTVNEATLDGRVPLNEEIQYTLIHDDLTGTIKFFLNGVVQTGIATNVTLKEFNDINMWLGRGQWNDPLFIGSFNECRIYDTALTAEEVALSYLAGPDELPVMAEPCPVDIAGDLNNDCVMDIVDAAMLADQFLTQKLQAEMEEE